MTIFKEIFFQKIFWIFLIMLLMFCYENQGNAVLAAEMPNFTRLNAIRSGLSSPTAVAVDNDGRLYVAQPVLNNVEVLSQAGKRIHTIEELAEPVSLAVAADGRIFIGNRERGNVEVYNPDFTLLKKLGNGDDEFTEPKDIAFDSAGNIYVADKADHVIKIYNPDGTYKATHGTPGNGDGEFYHPVSIAIDKSANQLVVLDLQPVQDTFYPGKLIDGARIQKFNITSDGIEFAQSFSKFGLNLDTGEMARPMHLEVDKQGRYYVSNCWPMGKVVVYDSSGNFLGLLDDETHSLKVPLGLALADTNRLYIVSSVNQDLEVYGLDNNYLSLDVTPLSLSFLFQDGENSTATKKLTVQNTGAVGFDWTATTNDTWISLDSASLGGYVEQGLSSTIDIGVVEGLSPGRYAGSVEVSAGGLVAEVIDVAAEIIPNYALSVLPGALNFTSDVGITPVFQTLSISNNGAGTLQWSAHADQEWISLSGGSGTAPDEINVFVDVSFKPVGSYSGNIVVSIDGESNMGPVSIPVTLTLDDIPPVVEPPPETPSSGESWRGNHSMLWTMSAQLAGISLNGIWGNSNTDIFVVGDNGCIHHFDGTSWNSMDSGTNESINSIWGNSGSYVFAVGDNGVILFFDGEGWSSLVPVLDASLKNVWSNAIEEFFVVGQNGSVLNGAMNSRWDIMHYSENIPALQGVWGSSDTNIYAVGDNGLILHYTGAYWAIIDSGASRQLNGIWGSSETDIYVVGADGLILHFDGTSWSKMESGTTETLTGVWGNSMNEVFAVGENGTMLCFKGSTWFKVETGLAENLNDVWSGKSKEVYAVGSDGSIIYGHAAFPWIILQPMFNHNAKQMVLKEQEMSE